MPVKRALIFLPLWKKPWAFHFHHNDANLGAVGERVWGVGQGDDDLVYIKV